VLADRAAAAQLSPRKVYGSDRGTERCPAAASALGHAAAGRRPVGRSAPTPSPELGGRPPASCWSSSRRHRCARLAVAL